MIEIIFTRPLTIYNSSELINSALFSKAKPVHSPRLVKFYSFNFDQKRCNTSKVVCCIFSSDSQLCVVGFLIKQFFYSGLLDMK